MTKSSMKIQRCKSWRIEMKTLLKAVVGLFITVSAAQASVINWVSSPDANDVTFGQTVLTGVNQVNFLENQSQPEGIYGAGFSLTTNAVNVNFDSDLYSWDSYNASTGAGTGYWDAFVVMISDVGYYWDLGLADPITADASTFVWGGDKYGDGNLASYVTAPGNGDTISASSAGATQWYVSFVLDTKTDPYSDTSYPSWGSFHVDVPEPSTMLLLGAGLIGLSFAGSRKRKVS